MLTTPRTRPLAGTIILAALAVTLTLACERADCDSVRPRTGCHGPTTPTDTTTTTTDTTTTATRNP